MEQDGRSAGPEDPNFRRACDQCRTRKIRCDKTTPCSNCRVAMRVCSSIGITHKPREQKQRVLISHQYERKIDVIEERLSGIEEALRTIAANSTSSGGDGSRVTQSTPSTSASYRETTQPVQDDDDDYDSGSAYEGELSLTAHTEFARDFLENAVGRASLDDLSPNMQSGLSALRQLVTMRNTSSTIRDQKFSMAQPMPPGGLMDLPMPPMRAVIGLLKSHKRGPTGVFEIACSFIPIDEVLDLCRKVYFCTDTISHSTFIIVNGCLYYLFADHFFQAKDPAIKQDFEEFTRMCRSNLETSLSHMPLLLPAKAESIRALLVAGNYAINLAKPSLAWQFSSAAVNLCQILGYHREYHVKPEKPGQRNTRALLFWHVYLLDKSLSLRLGISSGLRNPDITVSRSIDSSVVEDPWGPIISNWIEECDIANRIYEELYSPAALAKPAVERIAIARRLEVDQKRVMAAACQVREQALFGLRAVNASALLDVHIRGDEIAYHSALTLIHRAIPAPEGSPSRFTAECLDTARFAMQVHHECMQTIEGEGPDVTTVFVHWTILFTPFAPFFVLFCYVIETSSADDLRRLFDFVESLRPIGASSEPVQKMYQLCQVLCNVAHAYAEAKSQQTTASDPINREFDIYLTALGFPPSDPLAAPNSGPDATPGQPALQTEQLANWFSGNQQMMGLLEGDLSQFGPGPWTQ